MKKRNQTPDDKGHPYSKRTKQATSKPTIKLGKEDFESVSPLARSVETKGIGRSQKKILEHNEGPKRSNKKNRK